MLLKKKRFDTEESWMDAPNEFSVRKEPKSLLCMWASLGSK